jgi:hypothetical protein
MVRASAAGKMEFAAIDNTMRFLEREIGDYLKRRGSGLPTTFGSPDKPLIFNDIERTLQ